MSYLAHPAEKQKTELARAFNRLPGCEASASTNQDLVILVTDTKNEQEEEELQGKLTEVPHLASLTLVSAHSDQM